MRKSITILILNLILIQSSFAQTTVCLGTDATVCVGSSVQIDNCGGLGSIGTSGISLTSPTTVSLTDDSYSGVVNLGFTFNFYGQNYTQCVIGSNGVVTFNLAKANGYCPWSLGGVGTLPNTTFDDAKNAQMPAYYDMNPSAFASPNGEILYETIGTAPNRRFVVLYKDINAFGPSGVCSYLGVIMNETSNTFEFHIGNKPSVPTWNGGLAIQGSENIGGTVAHITPGRNNSQWNAFQEGKIWTPTTPGNTTNYTISNIPYIMILSPNSTFEWLSTNGTSYPYNNGSLTINPVLAGAPIGYFISVSAATCNNSVGAVSDTTWITSVSSSVSATSVSDLCSAGIGSVTATPTSGIPPYTFNWPALGAVTQTVNNVSAGNYQVQMTDGNGCTSTANVVVGDTPATFSGTTTIVSCPGGSDGTAFAEMVPALGNVTYQWDDPAGQTTQTAIGLTAGQYNCTVTSDIGCFDIVTVNVTEIPGMIGVITSQTDVTCNSGSDGIIQLNVTQGTPPYQYSWDNSTSTTNMANDLMVGPHVITVTDSKGCVITINAMLGEPLPLSITFLTPDTQICPEDKIDLFVTGSGGSSPYTFTWYENSTFIGNGDMITVDPEFTNTTYCVALTEDCGSPKDSTCSLIYFPTPIIPSAVPDEYEKCVPGLFEFTNTSTNQSEIASTYWDFGNNDIRILEIGADSTSLLFRRVGIHDLILTTTSIFGCVYTDTIDNILEVKPTPVADFFFSTNPATIFETTVFMQNKSSADVVSWNWYSPGSIPTTSTSKNPVLEFPEGVPGVYSVMLAVETERGCVDTTTLYFNVVHDILFYAPNAFTPDGDEFNQVWKPEITGIDIYDFELEIYNRWGEVIWENHDPSVGWDGTFNGKIMPVGTYVWRARVNKLYNDDKAEFNGVINLVK